MLNEWLAAGRPDPFVWCLARGYRVMTLFDLMRENGVEWSETKPVSQDRWRRGVQQTYTGRPFDFFNPDPDQICIEDIAHSLSQKCRFNGHTRKFYSVAQHSIAVANWVGEPYVILALLHDAAEAYGGDLPAPLKELPQFQFYRDAEARVTEVILEKFDVYRTAEGWKEVNDADRRIVRDESSAFLPNAAEWNFRCGERLWSDDLDPESPEVAKSDFLDAFEIYGSKK